MLKANYDNFFKSDFVVYSLLVILKVLIESLDCSKVSTFCPDFDREKFQDWVSLYYGWVKRINNFQKLFWPGDLI
jgi:hypothetical protein